MFMTFAIAKFLSRHFENCQKVGNAWHSIKNFESNFRIRLWLYSVFFRYSVLLEIAFHCVRFKYSLRIFRKKISIAIVRIFNISFIIIYSKEIEFPVHFGVCRRRWIGQGNGGDSQYALEKNKAWKRYEKN